MKKYKTSEAIAMLEKNPEWKFKDNRGSILYLSKYGFLRINHPANTKLEGIDGNVKPSDEWELVQEPVDYLTAVKAYAEGKTIRCERNGEVIGKMIPGKSVALNSEDKYYVRIYLQHSGCERNLTVTNILQDSWYVEE